jgi:membrane associated rhomboid family serine protease
MVIPIYDHSSFKWPTPPYVTCSVIALNIVVFLIEITASRTEHGVAYMAHVGGLTAGVIMFLILRPPGVQLFECVEPQAGPGGRRHLFWWPRQSR